jgi:glycosyltransferase involved in cell wall biosynthesis
MSHQVGLVMSSFLRSDLLDLGLSSIVKNKPNFPLEVVVVNDGREDSTEEVCHKYDEVLDIKYFFSGIRNKDGLVPRGPAIANNIGIKKSSCDILVLTCPEIYHLNDCLNKIVLPLYNDKKYMSIPSSIYFDDGGIYTTCVRNSEYASLELCNIRNDSVEMPFLLGIWKSELFDIGGYDEDFIGYASEDNDLIGRLRKNGCRHYKVDAKIVHLYHGPRCPDGLMWDNPRWAYNRRLYESRKTRIIRNIGREWGVLDG